MRTTLPPDRLPNSGSWNCRESTTLELINANSVRLFSGKPYGSRPVFSIPALTRSRGWGHRKPSFLWTDCWGWTDERSLLPDTPERNITHTQTLVDHIRWWWFLLRLVSLLTVESDAACTLSATDRVHKGLSHWGRCRHCHKPVALPGYVLSFFPQPTALLDGGSRARFIYFTFI